MKLQKIIDILESIAPVQDAYEWDNVGLMIGLVDQEISKILISLDFDENAVNCAIEHGADLIITHHPAIFKPIKRITDKNIIRTIKNDIAVYSAHTNLDVAVGGVNYVLADALEVYNCSQYGILRVGYIDSMTFGEVIDKVKRSLDVSALRIVGSIDKPIRKVAVIGGAGGDFVSYACDLGCDLIITGECKYDQAQNAYNQGIALIAAGHFETENPVVHKLADTLRRRIDVDIIEATSKNIFNII